MFSDVKLAGLGRAAVAAAATLMVIAMLAPGARAATLLTTCANFQNTLTSAGAGDTIVLTGLCTTPNANFVLPATTNLTIEGAATGTNGFDGAGVSSPALASPGGGTDGLTLSNLTFENYTSSTAVQVTSTTTTTNEFVFSGDTFSHDGGSGNGGGLSMTLFESGSCAFARAAVTLSNSTFSGDTAGAPVTAQVDGGGGAFVDIECESGSVSANVTGNTFSGDSVKAPNNRAGYGGGLVIGPAGAHIIEASPVTLTQSGNLFTGNSITGTNGFEYAGGGEFVDGTNMTSTGDAFIGNSLPGPAALGESSEGAGLAAFGGGNCTNQPGGPTSQAGNLVAAGNTIGAPSGTATNADAEGAGVYVGCAVGGSGYHMTLISSTVSGNTAPGTGAVAGVDGENIDFLNLQNTIVSGDNGGSELGGFNSGANVTASSSDICAIGSSTTAFAGTGNICADPKLVNPTAGDVHETSASPTIDVGSNALVPGGLTTDYYGNPRIAVGRNPDPATVDIGAQERLANPVITDCSKLQGALNAAGPGDVITISTLCTGGKYTLPSVSNLTIQGAATGTNGFDGTGATGPALVGRAVGLTLRNLTFQNYKLNSGPAVFLEPGAGALPVLDRDRFLNNSTMSSTPGAALEILDTESSCPYTGSLTLTNSLFSMNSISQGASPSGISAEGAGAAILLACDASHGASLTISGNTFTGNSIAMAGGSAYGGGLYAADSGNGQLTDNQSANLFQSNSVTSTSPSGATFDGGGEWLASVNLTSRSDAFISNSLAGPSGASGASEGGGLGTVRGTCGIPPSSVPASATATDLVAAANSIGAPSSGGSIEGAGVYAGLAICIAGQGNAGFHLTLNDSTVSGNSGAGGVAGVDGESGDQLTLQNSIVFGNAGAGASDLGGFGIGGGSGSVIASFSDVCTPGATTPFMGTGNICADPKLTNAAGGDVHETSASPTIDAGSNALVPSGVTTDYYGQPRIVATHQCQAIVDIGAAESPTPFAGNCTTGGGGGGGGTGGPGTVGKTQFGKENANSHGVDLTIHCAGTAPQTCTGTITLITTEVERGSTVIAVTSRKRKPKLRKVTALIGSVNYKLGAGKTITVHVNLNRTGIKLLQHFHALPVTVQITQVTKPGHPGTTISRRKLTIHLPKPKPKHRR